MDQPEGFRKCVNQALVHGLPDQAEVKHTLEGITKRWKSRAKERVAADLQAGMLQLAIRKTETLQRRSTVDEKVHEVNNVDSIIGESNVFQNNQSIVEGGETARPPTGAEEVHYNQNDKPKAVSEVSAIELR